MALPQGINFRSTAGFVTDPANYDVEHGTSVTYPWSTAQGNIVGLEYASANNDNRNRNSGNDPRLAGIAFHGTVDMDFRIDLPSSGNYNIGLAAGDASYACAVTVDLYDTSSSLGSLSTGSTSGSQRFKDATDTEYTDATWPTSQTLVTKAFSTTICRFRVLWTAGLTRVSSVYVEAAAAGQPANVFLGQTRSSLIWR